MNANLSDDELELSGKATTVLQKPTPDVLLNDRQRFLNACRCQLVDRPPVWLMRQAGRALPEYRALKEKYSFLELVQTPELAAEVTLQPIRRFGFDAAILFSDILVICGSAGAGVSLQGQGRDRNGVCPEVGPRY